MSCKFVKLYFSLIRIYFSLDIFWFYIRSIDILNVINFKRDTFLRFVKLHGINNRGTIGKSFLLFIKRQKINSFNKITLQTLRSTLFLSLIWILFFDMRNIILNREWIVDFHANIFYITYVLHVLHKCMTRHLKLCNTWKIHFISTTKQRLKLEFRVIRIKIVVKIIFFQK